MPVKLFRRILPPLHRAAVLGDETLVETLCADFDAEQPFRGWRPIEWACRYGQTEVVRLFLDRGVDAWGHYDGLYPDRSSYGLLHLATVADCIPLIKFLLTRGMSIDETNISGATPLHLPRSRRMVEFLLPLVQHQSSRGIDAWDDEGLTPLHYAACSGRSRVLRCLLDAGADPHFDDCEAGRPAIHRAARKRHLRACQLLLQAGVDINSPDMYGCTALDQTLTYRAACDANRHISLTVFVSWMLEQGAKASKFSDHEIAELALPVDFFNSLGGPYSGSSDSYKAG